MTKLTYIMQPEKNELGAKNELYQADSEILKKIGLGESDFTE